MAFDECTAYPAEYNGRKKCDGAYTPLGESAVRDAKKRDDQALFGIVQGGMFKPIFGKISRTSTIADMDFPGNAIGGLSVGEPKPHDVRHAGRNSAAAAGRKAKIPDGRGLTGLPHRRRDAWRGYVRLRAADKAGAETAQHSPALGMLTIRNAAYTKDYEEA